MTVTIRTSTKPPVKMKHVSGFCQGGFDQKCPGAVRNGDGQVLLCPHHCHTNLRPYCMACGNRALDEDPNDPQINPITWLCYDQAECRADIERKREASDLYQRINASIKSANLRRENERNAPRHASASGKPRSGECLCCKAPTKGGLFLPGHDARFVSELVAEVQSKELTLEQARERLAPASPALKAKFDKRLK